MALLADMATPNVRTAARRYPGDLNSDRQARRTSLIIGAASDCGELYTIHQPRQRQRYCRLRHLPVKYTQMIHRRWVMAFLLAWLASDSARAQDAAPLQGKSTLVYIGTHTSDKARGIYLFRLQSAGTDVFQNVTLVPLGLAAESA